MGLINTIQTKTEQARAKERIRPLLESRMMRDILLEISQRGTEKLDPQSVPLDQRPLASKRAAECGTAGLQQSVIREILLDETGIVQRRCVPRCDPDFGHPGHAQDLGCNVWQILFRVLVPLTGPGIATGITQVFVPAVSTFIISRMLGGGSNLLIGDLIELQFLGNSYNLNLGSAMSLVLMVIVLLCMSFTSSFDESEMEGVM